MDKISRLIEDVTENMNYHDFTVIYEGRDYRVIFWRYIISGPNYVEIESPNSVNIIHNIAALVSIFADESRVLSDVVARNLRQAEVIPMVNVTVQKALMAPQHFLSQVVNDSGGYSVYDYLGQQLNLEQLKNQLKADYPGVFSLVVRGQERGVFFFVHNEKYVANNFTYSFDTLDTLDHIDQQEYNIDETPADFIDRVAHEKERRLEDQDRRKMMNAKRDKVESILSATLISLIKKAVRDGEISNIKLYSDGKHIRIKRSGSTVFLKIRLDSRLCESLGLKRYADLLMSTITLYSASGNSGITINSKKNKDIPEIDLGL